MSMSKSKTKRVFKRVCEALSGERKANPKSAIVASLSKGHKREFSKRSLRHWAGRGRKCKSQIGDSGVTEQGSQKKVFTRGSDALGGERQEMQIPNRR